MNRPEGFVQAASRDKISLRDAYPIPRPKALLGHQYFTQLLQQIQRVRALHPPDTFKTLYLSAAGSHSSIMQRIQEELATHTGLQIASHEGDLLRLRPSPNGEGWQSLVRLTSRPLPRVFGVCVTLKARPTRQLPAA